MLESGAASLTKPPGAPRWSVPPGSTSQKNEVLVGKLGLAEKPSPIHARANKASAVLYRTKPFQYLVLKETKSPDWTGVLLQNGATGFIDTKDVVRLPFEVWNDANSPGPKWPKNLSPSDDLTAKDAKKLMTMGSPVTRFEDLKQGDRLFFWSKAKGRVNAMGVFLGNGYFAGGGSRGASAAVHYLGDKVWKNALVCARRIR